MNEEKSFKRKIAEFHDKNYKLLLLIPIAVLLSSFVYLFVFYSNTGDFVYKDISLTGGTSVTISGEISPEEIELALSDKLDEINTRIVYDLITREQTGLIIQTKSSADLTEEVLENYLGYNLDSENSSFEFISSDLGESFYKELLIAVFFAFVFMAAIVFFIFRNFVPSIAVILSAFANIIMTLAVVDLLGIKMSSAGIVAFLMLIGYSVDTDILLTNKVLKRHDGTLNQRIFSAFKTGITMTFTSLLAVLSALIVALSFSELLTQIFLVLFIGLWFDLLNTWITNVSLLKWYVKKKEKDQ